MKIELMNENHLSQILSIDQDAFEREEPRTILNLKGLIKGDPEGCFVLMEGEEIFGYAFNKTMGDEGYMGPVGIKTSLHGQGYGQKLIQQSLDYLKARCTVIGLEVRPEIGKNIGLYHKIGFQTAFPSFILEVPQKLRAAQKLKVPPKFDSHKKLKVPRKLIAPQKLETPQKPETNKPKLDNLLNDVTNSNDNYGVQLYSQLSENERNRIINDIEIWTRRDLNRISYKNDLKLIDPHFGDIIIITEDNKPVGFLTYFSIVFLHLWGAIKPSDCQDDILKIALNVFREINSQDEVLLEVNTRYRDLVDLLMNNGFKIRKSVIRMVLKGFEGEYFQESNEFVMRAWHA